MGQRREARKSSIRALYTAELLGLPLEDIWDILSDEGDDEPEEFARELAAGVYKNLDFIDSVISRYTQNWESERIAAVDKAIIRLGLYEIFFEESIPRSVSINEAVELAKHFSTGKSHKFVNGILDSASRKNKSELKE